LALNPDPGRRRLFAEADMKREHVAVVIFSALIVIALYLFYRMLSPFLPSIIWGAVLAGIFYPLNALLKRRLRRANVRAVIMCIIVVAVIIVPAAFLAVGLTGEVISGLPQMKAAVEAGQLDFILKPEAYGWNEKIKNALAPYLDVSDLDVESLILENIQRLTQYLIGQVSGFVGNFSAAVVSFVFAVLSMFFFFRDGDRFVSRLRELLPMSEELKSNLTRRLKEVIEASIYGGVLVAAVQGILGGLMFWILGLPSPIFWGTVMAMLSLLPIVGAYLVFLPASIILFASGSWVRGTILFTWGTIVVSQSDNLLRPVIVGNRTKIHTMVLFFSILGGIKVFGLLGILLGPVLASVVYTFVEVYRSKRDRGVPDAASPHPSPTSEHT
jgi:predicted PurR-regulated permease PerM